MGRSGRRRAVYLGLPLSAASRKRKGATVSRSDLDKAMNPNFPNNPAARAPGSRRFELYDGRGPLRLEVSHGQREFVADSLN